MSKAAAISKDDLTTKEVVVYTAGSVLLAGGSIWLISHLVKKAVSNNQENKSFEDGSTATYAKGIKMAFENDGWPGTNVTEVRRILRSIPTREVFEKVVKSYKQLYGQNLLRDMSDELQSSEYNEMLNIIASKPAKLVSGQTTSFNYSAWAKRLNAAFEKSYGFMPGTDEEAIKAVFQEIPTQTAFKEVAKSYQDEYNSSLIEDLKSELEFWEYTEYMSIITQKPLY